MPLAEAIVAEVTRVAAVGVRHQRVGIGDEGDLLRLIGVAAAEGHRPLASAKLKSHWV
jgi:hypothetical protein